MYSAFAYRNLMNESFKNNFKTIINGASGGNSLLSYKGFEYKNCESLDFFCENTSMRSTCFHSC